MHENNSCTTHFAYRVQPIQRLQTIILQTCLKFDSKTKKQNWMKSAFVVCSVYQLQTVTNVSQRVYTASLWVNSHKERMRLNNNIRVDAILLKQTTKQIDILIFFSLVQLHNKLAAADCASRIWACLTMGATKDLLWDTRKSAVKMNIVKRNYSLQSLWLILSNIEMGD